VKKKRRKSTVAGLLRDGKALGMKEGGKNNLQTRLSLDERKTNPETQEVALELKEFRRSERGGHRRGHEGDIAMSTKKNETAHRGAAGKETYTAVKYKRGEQHSKRGGEGTKKTGVKKAGGPHATIKVTT